MRRTARFCECMRWDVHAQPPLREPVASRVRHAGFVRGVALADNAAFGVSPAEASAMDPCQRLLLERGYTRLHGSGLDRGALGGSLTGVFLGFAGTEFAQVLAALLHCTRGRATRRPPRLPALGAARATH